MKASNYRRGSIGDIITILMSAFFIGVVFIIIALALYHIKEAFVSADIPVEAKTLITQGESGYANILDSLLAFFFIGMPLIAGTLAFFLQTSMLFFWLVIAFSFFYILLGAVLSYLWHVSIVESGAFAMILAKMPISEWVFGNFALYSLFVVAIIVAGTFLKFRKTEAEY